MSEIESGGGEISSSSEVSETSVAETGGESTEATQEAVTEEASGSGGFDENADTTESPEDSTEEYDEPDYEDELDESQEVGFSESDEIENDNSQYDNSDYEDEDSIPSDEDGVGFDDSDETYGDVNNDSELNENDDFSDSPMNEDGEESFDEPSDNSVETSESDWDDQDGDEDIGETEDYFEEEPLDDGTEDGDDIDATQDDSKAEIEDTDSNTDANEGDNDVDNDGELDDVEIDADTEDVDVDDFDEDEDLGESEEYSDGESLSDSTEDDDDIDATQDNSEAEIEDTDSNTDGTEADGDMDNDGELDDVETDADTEADGDINDAQDDGEGEIEDTDSNTDGNEADSDIDNDDELDDAETDTDTEDGNVDDFDENEDPGELEEYSDEESLNDSTDDNDDIDATQDDGKLDDAEADTDIEANGDVNDAQDDDEAEIEDTDSNTDGNEADGDVDNDGELDDVETDTDTEDSDDIDVTQDDGEAEIEDTDSNTDGNEADGDVDNDGELDDVETDTDTEVDDDIDDAQDDGEAEIEDTDSNTDGNEADNDMDNDGELDDAETDTDTEDGDDIDDAQDDGEADADDANASVDENETETDVESDVDDVEDDGDADIDDVESDDSEANIEDDDDDEDEDPGELEDYSDEDNISRNEDAETTDDSESEREDAEEKAIEDDKEATDRAEDESENVDDAAESENRNPSENAAEQSTESVETEDNNEVDNENNSSMISEDDDNEAQTDGVDSKEDNPSDIDDQSWEQPDNIANKAETIEGEDAYRTAMNNMADYMNEHNYGREDYAEYSQDPEWQELNAALQKAQGIEPESNSTDIPTHDEALANMAQYMNEHNYGRDDYAEYSQDPEWQKLNADLQQSSDTEVPTEASTPSPESGKDVSATELPDNCVMVNASDIDMTYAQGMESDQFWNHHGNTKEDYMQMAERIPDVQQALNSGKSLDEIKQDPELKDAAHAYFDPENMIKVEQQSDGSYSFVDDGRHRIAAAQELGYEIPVEVTNMPENSNAATVDNTDMKPEVTTLPEDAVNKSDISSETRENLGAFEQNKWDNLSQVEKEQAVEKLRDSIAEDLQLENKPNVAYYNKEDPGDYGGYAASTNTIYINRFNMGDATETADTIAHESRHCWQHERADHPLTEQDYQFKENFNDYVRPEDDYRGYRDQPVEADAREYAQNITDSIPTGHPNKASEITPENTNSNATEREIRQREEGKGAVFDGSSEIPTDIDKKVDDFESKVKTPEDYSSKFEFDTQKKLENYYKENGGELSNEQKQQLVSDLKDSYDGTDKSARCDVLVPENAKDVTSVYYNGKIGKYDVAYDWKSVDTVPESRHMEVLKEGQQFDRVGPSSGRCTGAVGEDGGCASAKERSIPYHLTEDDITKEPSYHRYVAEQDFTKENLSNAIDNSMYSDDKKAEMHANLDRYYETAKTKGYGDGDGLASGKIAPMFENTTGATGGGKQYDMPFSMEELENIGMISEVPKDEY